MSTAISGAMGHWRYNNLGQGSANRERLTGACANALSTQLLRNKRVLEDGSKRPRSSQSGSSSAGDVNADAAPVVERESILLMEQLAAARSHALPEERLMVAILEDVIDCLRKYRRSKGAHGQKLFREAQEWMASRQSSWLFSFERICAILGLDPVRVRRVAEVHG